MASNMNKELVAERSTLIGYLQVTSRLHVQRPDVSDHQPPHCNVDTSRPLGAVGHQWRLGLPEGRIFPFRRVNRRPAHVDLVWRLYGDCMENVGQTENLHVNRRSKRGVIGTHTASSSIPLLSKRRFQQMQLETLFQMVAVELSQGMQTRRVPVSR